MTLSMKAMKFRKKRQFVKKKEKEIKKIILNLV